MTIEEKVRNELREIGRDPSMQRHTGQKRILDLSIEVA
jgi:hypothetical protein